MKLITQWLWDFFASIKVAIVIIAMITLTAILGTILPQESVVPSPVPELYYNQTYGWFGDFYYQSGLANMYTSWWFITLILLLAISLVVCSLERVIPLYKSLQRQEVKPALSRITRSPIYVGWTGKTQEKSDEIVSVLKKKRYKIRQEGHAVFAEKGRFARYGAYVIHIGLLIMIAGAMSRLIPGWYYSGNIWIEEGETVAIPTTDFYLRNNNFTVEFYNDGRPKMYQTDATVVKNGKDIETSSIIVNKPLDYEGVKLFQANFLPPIIRTLSVNLLDKQTQKAFGNFTINFKDIKESYQVGPYTVRIRDYYPDFQIDATGKPTTKTTDPNNPGFMMQVEGPNIKEPQLQWYFPLFQMPFAQNTPFSFKATDGKFVETTGIRVQKDRGIPIVYFGTAIVMLGLVMVFYFQHRRIWIRPEEDGLHIGAQTNKNWYGIRKEVQVMMNQAGWDGTVEIVKGGRST